MFWAYLIIGFVSSMVWVMHWDFENKAEAAPFIGFVILLLTFFWPVALALLLLMGLLTLLGDFVLWLRRFAGR